jgi:hypothetical protein
VIVGAPLAVTQHHLLLLRLVRVEDGYAVVGRCAPPSASVAAVRPGASDARWLDAWRMCGGWKHGGIPPYAPLYALVMMLMAEHTSRFHGRERAVR